MSPTADEIVEVPLTSHDEAAMSAHVQYVAQSALFLRADTLRKLLLYLWAHRDEEINEYAVATEALGRRADFDPKTDASVRVQISRLRRKLKDFYETEGFQSVYVLQIPMGTHTLAILEGNGSPLSLPLVELEPMPSVDRRGWINALLVIACGLLIVAVGILSWNLHKTKLMALRLNLVPTGFWTSFVGTDAPVKIILPTPVFFTFPDATNLHIRDVKVNEYPLWNLSKTVSTMVQANGTPKLDHSYTVTSDTLAAIELARYLDRVGLAERVDFEISEDSTMNLLERSSVIAFGAHATLHPFRDYLQSMNFALTEDEVSVHNAVPAPGEQPSYDLVREGDVRKLEPSIVAVLPGRSPGKKLLILQSRHTIALVAMMTSKVGDSLFQKIYQGHASPPYFEMVVMNETEGDHIIRSWPVAMHPYTKKAPTGADVTQ
jgi:hypothetical protein